MIRNWVREGMLSWLLGKTSVRNSALDRLLSAMGGHCRVWGGLAVCHILARNIT